MSATPRIDGRQMREVHHAMVTLDINDPTPLGMWDPNSDFEDSNIIILAFRMNGDKEVEHWANNLACYMTRERGEVRPAGEICHAEIMLQQTPGAWRRFSIMKKTGELGPKGKIIFKPGTVHGLETDAAHIKKYTFFRIHVPREEQYKGWRFFNKQIGAPFNMRAYVLNINPFFKFGATYFQEHMYRQRQARGFFCTELITLGLHAMGLMKDVRACDSSPNLLYRKCVRMIGAQPSGSNPIVG